MLYRHERKFQILYSDCDEFDELKPSALLNFAQDAAGSSAYELGFGYETLIKDGCGFITTATCCKRLKPVCAKEEITVATYPITPRRVIFERDYEVFNQKGEKVALLSTRWCLLDFATQKLLPPERLAAHAACPYRNDRVFEPDYRAERVKEDAREAYSLTVRPSLCDHYHHVNNAKYMDLFLDCFSSEEWQKQRVSSFTISYAKQVRQGEEVRLFRSDIQNGSALEARVNGEATTRLSLSFERR